MPTIEVASLAPLVRMDEKPVCIVVDVVRASTSIITMMEKGCQSVLLLGSLNEVEAVKSAQPSLLICAEDASGNTAPSADFNPSPTEMEEDFLNGKQTALCTSNGTKTAAALRDGGIDDMLIGCLRNAKEVMRAAVSLAEQKDKDIVIVCAGREGANVAAMDDMYCAGVMVEEAINLANDKLIVRDTALMAKHLTEIYPDGYTALRTSESARNMLKIDKDIDLQYCGEVNQSSVVPIINLDNNSDKMLVEGTKKSMII
ncbi:2-phosphosulfolactate phosphatase [Aquibacillus albus]|uniref:Probable 2-phosphosulfolactate phosphatase n=1 Tax=Aquibacillus albus TaxID=1168171 RepID=A0ABS2MYG7_9BACI|nr:2-phosphosulfolactate phosphatase [Aquibacillus albus]MBM7570720.1 2-phosphosulfolactate phosphatase [Aquibacillus albus]